MKKISGPRFVLIAIGSINTELDKICQQVSVKLAYSVISGSRCSEIQGAILKIQRGLSVESEEVNMTMEV